MKNYISETPILNFSHPDIEALVERRGWKVMTNERKIKEIYDFCRDEILFGFNSSTDDMSASEVLGENRGHCNTKATLFMALLRAVGIPCRLHAFTIDKKLQKGAMGIVAYFLAPKEIIHTWVEVFYNNQWINMEGLILDSAYLTSIQHKFKDIQGPFCGYAVATADLHHPKVEWHGGDTYIQKDGIVRDFGIYDSPDDFYRAYGTNVKGIKKVIYENIIHKMMNANVDKLRNSCMIS